MIIWFKCVAVRHEGTSVYRDYETQVFFHDAFIISIYLTPIRFLLFSLDEGTSWKLQLIIYITSRIKNTRSFDLEEEEVLIPGLVDVFFLCINGETRLLRILGQQSLQ